MTHAAFAQEIPQQTQVTTRLLGGQGHPAHFRLPGSAPLLDVLREGAEQAHVALLPNPDDPLDRLHDVRAHDEVGPAIQDLDKALGEFLESAGTTHDFVVELVRAFRVNTRWAVAQQASMTPREILALPAINLAPQDYTLYLPSSNEPLPLDTPIAVERASVFEAQRDGRYGAATS